MTIDPGTPPADAAARAFREEGPAVLATLARRLGGDLDLAEDALQDALADALRSWPRDGVPDRPGAWITVAARRRAIDRLRTEQAIGDRAAQLGRLVALDAAAAPEPEEEEETPVEDDRLRLMFTCCHPSLSPEARVALTLRMLGGLTTAEVARAFLVPEPTMAQRIVRAKRKIAVARIPYRVPREADLPERAAGVLSVLYLIFNEGHQATAGDRLVRGDLCAEAIRLTRLVAAMLRDDAEAWALLGLMLLTRAREEARVDEAGRYVALDRQDRARWDGAAIAEGIAALDRAARLGPPGPYALQGRIAAEHAAAVRSEDTDWAAIAGLYGALSAIAPSPVVEVNRAVAVSFAGDAAGGLAILAPLLDDARLARHVPLHAAHADLLRRTGDGPGALAAYDRAIAASGNAVERAELERRRAELAATTGS